MLPSERQDPSSLPGGAKVYRRDNLTSTGQSQALSAPYMFNDKSYTPGSNSHWKTTVAGLNRLAELERLEVVGNTLAYRRFLDDFAVFPLTNVWSDTGTGGYTEPKIYVVQTNQKIVARCLLMTTDPGDLVLDPTCGSGTTAFVAEQFGRRWITCDTSRVSVVLAKQRLATAVYDYYVLAHPDEGVGSGFRYRTMPHVTLGGLANSEPPTEEQVYDQPLVDKAKLRVSGPFTVEAVPAPVVRPVDELPEEPVSDASVARTGPTLRQAEWRAHIARAGVRGRGGAKIEFSRVELQGGTRYIHATAETKDAKPQIVGISFGPEYAPLEQRQVELAWEEARELSPRPTILLFAAFQFDPEAAKDIDELDPEKSGMTFLRVQMDPDLLVDDLRKKSAGDHSFWLVGQADVQVQKVEDGRFRVEVAGFDYYNPRSGTIDSGDTSKIAMWLLDTDYDGRSLLPQQVFFPMAGAKDGWSRLARELKAVVDEDLLEAYRGTTSLPFEVGAHKRAAVKIVDDRGIESLKLLELE